MTERSTLPDTPDVQQAPPCTLVIFGANGDLTKRLLMPALYNLAGRKVLPDRFKVIGVDRMQSESTGWCSSLTDSMQSFTKDKTAEFYISKLDGLAWKWLTDRLAYTQGDFSESETFQQLAEILTDESAVFYLAVASRLFGTVVDGLGKAGLLKQTNGRFRRVVIEKPFGADLPSAQALNASILKQADESQFFRIDHFLGKETVQAIMPLRFANKLLEPAWRREHIDHVQITAVETVGVEGRGAFYEPTGALRDMVPNHLFTLLGMVAMEPPDTLDAEAVREERARLLAAIRPLCESDVVRGQYGPGRELDTNVVGYQNESDVAPESRTETYVALRLYIENARWAGVPFYLRTGKRLAERRTEISVHFKLSPYGMFHETHVETLTPNVLRLLIDPDPGIEIQLDAKLPGPQLRLGRVETSLRYGQLFPEQPTVGYETLLYHCMTGNVTLFQRADAIEASWAVLQPVLESWDRGEGKVESYNAGSQGPPNADSLLERDGRRWL